MSRMRKLFPKYSGCSLSTVFAASSTCFWKSPWSWRSHLPFHLSIAGRPHDIPGSGLGAEVGLAVGVGVAAPAGVGSGPTLVEPPHMTSNEPATITNGKAQTERERTNDI